MKADEISKLFTEILEKLNSMRDMEYCTSRGYGDNINRGKMKV